MFLRPALRAGGAAAFQHIHILIIHMIIVGAGPVFTSGPSLGHDIGHAALPDLRIFYHIIILVHKCSPHGGVPAVRFVLLTRSAVTLWWEPSSGKRRRPPPALSVSYSARSLRLRSYGSPNSTSDSCRAKSSLQNLASPPDTQALSPSLGNTTFRGDQNAAARSGAAAVGTVADPRSSQRGITRTLR